MSQEIIIVGAGPIGLWLAVQVKLQRPNITIVFKEKYYEYQRTHTMKLEHKSFAGCLEDDGGIIKGIKAQVKKNPHIRTDVLESKMLDLAKSLGITVDYEKVADVEKDIAQKYPECAMIIGADGVRSLVREQVFGADNAERTPLAYSAQIKYFVKEDTSVADSALQAYPLLKHSNFLSFTSVGKKHAGKTPVTVQHFIDKATYEKIKGFGFTKPVKLFSDDVETKLPAQLLQDVKTQVGFRLANKEDVLVDSVQLTATELPQQRCKKTIAFQNGRYYALTGDAALALSFFKGMNAGLKLATQFSKSIVLDWDKILERDPTALTSYETYYDTFAKSAIQSGEKTGSTLSLLDSTIHVLANTPFQLHYYTNNDILKYRRHFDALHQVSQFYLTVYPDEASTTSVQSLKDFLKEQLIPSLPVLRANVQKAAEKYKDDPKMHAALKTLSEIKTEKLDLHEKAYFALAMSKTCDLLEAPTEDKYTKYTQFIVGIKSAKPGLYHLLGAILEVVAGVVAVALGIAALVISVGASAPFSAPVIVAGTLLASHGVFQLSRNMAGESETYQAVQSIGGMLNKP